MPSRQEHNPAGRVGLALGVVTSGIVAAFIGVFALNYVVPVPKLKKFVDIGGEANLPTWWNASLLMMVGIGAVVARMLDVDRRRRRAWLVVALAGMYLSLDETASLHERLAAPVRSVGVDVPTYAWLLPGVVVAVAGSVVLVLVARALPRPTQRLLALALLVYGAGAVAMEAVNGWFRSRELDLLFSAGITLEETMEMTACILAIMAIVETVHGDEGRVGEERAT